MNTVGLSVVLLSMVTTVSPIHIDLGNTADIHSMLLLVI